jgi:hypothetical protein
VGIVRREQPKPASDLWRGRLAGRCVQTLELAVDAFMAAPLTVASAEALRLSAEFATLVLGHSARQREEVGIPRRSALRGRLKANRDHLAVVPECPSPEAIAAAHEELASTLEAFDAARPSRDEVDEEATWRLAEAAALAVDWLTGTLPVGVRE